MKLSNFISISLVAAAMAIPAYAATNQPSANDPEMQAVAAAKVSATDAVANVLKQAKGTVVEVTLDTFNGAPAYLVTLVDDAGTESNYLVDGTSGTVSVSADNSSDENAAEGEDDDKGQPEGTGEGDDSDANEG